MTKQLRITVDGKTYDVLVDTLDGSQAAPALAPVAAAPVAAAPVAAIAAPALVAAPVAAAPSAGGSPVPSPLSGTIVEIHVKEGQKVNEGDLLITLEAMKMNTPINAPKAGTVTGITAQKGASVEEGTCLLSIA